MKKINDDADVPRIVYWFGHKFDIAFSILKGENCISFEEGMKLGLSKWKAGVSRKLMLRAWDEMENAREEPICEKRIPFVKMMEVYEYVWGPKADRLMVEMEAENRQSGDI